MAKKTKNLLKKDVLPKTHHRTEKEKNSYTTLKAPRKSNSTVRSTGKRTRKGGASFGSSSTSNRFAFKGGSKISKGRTNRASYSQQQAYKRSPEEKQLIRDYRKALNRIRDYQARLMDRGYKYPPFVPELSFDNVSDSELTREFVDKIANLPSEYIYQFATYIDPETGEEMSGLEGRALERHRQALKAAATRKANKKAREREAQRADDVIYPERAPEGQENMPGYDDLVIDRLYEMCNSWQPKIVWTPEFAKIKEYDKNRLVGILDGQVMREGKTNLAKRVAPQALYLYDLCWQILYGSSGVNRDIETENLIIEFAQIITGGALSNDDLRDLAPEADKDMNGRVVNPKYELDYLDGSRN